MWLRSCGGISRAMGEPNYTGRLGEDQCLHCCQEGRRVMHDTLTTISCATEGHLWGALGKCVMCGHPAPPPGVALVSGIGRDAECAQALVIFCSRVPTDDEMRAIHDAAREVGKICHH